MIKVIHVGTHVWYARSWKVDHEYVSGILTLTKMIDGIKLEFHSEHVIEID